MLKMRRGFGGRNQFVCSLVTETASRHKFTSLRQIFVTTELVRLWHTMQLNPMKIGRGKLK